jgi:hypothetical protein
VLLAGLVFSAVGVLLVLGRRVLRIDRRRRTVTVSYGLPMPIRQTVRPWEEFTAIAVTRESRKTKNGSYIVYPVRMTGPGKPVLLEELRTYQPIRQTAEQVAAFMRLPMHDSSEGVLVVRDPEHLNESVRERLRRTAERSPLPPPPAGMRSRLFHKDRSVLIEMPAEGPDLRFLGILIAGMVFTVFVAVGVVVSLPLSIGGLPRPVVVALVVAALVVPEIAIGAFLLLRRRRPARLIVSPAGVRLEGGAAGGRAQEISSDAIEELTVLNTAMPAGMPAFVVSGLQRGVLLRSDTTTIEIGNSLAMEEKQYLAELIRHVLAS